LSFFPREAWGSGAGSAWYRRGRSQHNQSSAIVP